jgi:hypothetical protein
MEQKILKNRALNPRWCIILLILIFSITLFLGLVNASYTTDDVGIVLSSSAGGVTLRHGVEILASFNSTLSVVTLATGVDATVCSVYNGTGNVNIANASSVAGICIFSLGIVNFTAGQHYLIQADSAGAGYNLQYLTSTGLPKVGKNINYTRDAYAVGESWPIFATDEIDNIQNITTYNYTSTGNLTYQENSQTFSTPVDSGSSQVFQLNFNWNTTLFTSVNTTFFYNITPYSGTLIYSNGVNEIIASTINVPTLASSIIYPFHWQIQLINTTGIYYYNSSFNNQTVNTIMLDNCTTYTNLLLNYTLLDELSEIPINNSNSSIEINILLYNPSRSGLVANISRVYNATSYAFVCMQSALGSTAYSMDTTVKYSSTNYVTRYNYMQNFTVNNATIPQSVRLYDLSTSIATKFLINYKGPTFLAIPGALVSINRQYVSENQYKTVEIGLTNDNGQTNAWFDLNARYQIIISLNGQVLGVFTNQIPYCINPTTSECNFNLYQNYAFNAAPDFYTYNEMSYSYSFNKTTRAYTFSFATTDNSVALISINLTKLDAYQNITICSNQMLSSSGSLSCSVAASYGNVTFLASIWKNGQEIQENIYSIISPAAITFGGDYVIFIFGLVLCLGMMFIPSPIGVIVGSMVGLGIAAILFFLSGTGLLSGAFITLLIAAGIIIFVIRQRGAD